MTVEAILNDTVGTLMTGAYEDHDCAVGIIMGMSNQFIDATLKVTSHMSNSIIEARYTHYLWSYLCVNREQRGCLFEI